MTSITTGAAKRSAEDAGVDVVDTSKQSKNDKIDAANTTASVAVSSLGEQLEQQLRSQAEQWAAPSDLAMIPLATKDELPLLDLGPYLKALAASSHCSSPAVEAERAKLAAELRDVGENVGFHCIENHGIDAELIERTLGAARSFLALSQEVKTQYEMDKDGRLGVGYLAPKNFKLPAREKANMNQCFIVKQEPGPRDITLDSMPWPKDESTGSFRGDMFRSAVVESCTAFELLAQSMLPIYAEALKLDANYFQEAFLTPMYRFRLAHYPPTPPTEFGINPHVDTSFFTILATTGAGLVFHSAKSASWRRVPYVKDQLIVNTGQLLAQITNDQWRATRHYAVNAQDGDRYSLPFFFNATPSHKMAVVPTCCSPGKPAKYPPTSYLEGQGVAQGE